jgi:hypothetical protein
MRDGMIALLVLGVGGLFVYYIYRNQQEVALKQVTDRSSGQCGASYAGVGASIPCELIGQGAKAAYSWVKDESKPVVKEIKTATKDFGVLDVAQAPIGVTHALYNETLGRLF